MFTEDLTEDKSASGKVAEIEQLVGQERSLSSS
jgi:hypothetical protein